MKRTETLKMLEKLSHGEEITETESHFRYPTNISKYLAFTVRNVDVGEATIEVTSSVAKHANQQGTIHGGFIAELADAAIGTAQSTLLERGESFASVDLKISFLRPVWDDKLTATAWAKHQGKTISLFECEVKNSLGKVVAVANSALMTLRGSSASGR